MDDLLNQQLNTSKKKEQTLSERLAELESFYGSTVKPVVDSRPYGAMPSAGLGAIFETLGSRQGLLTQQEGERDRQTTILGQLAQLAEQQAQQAEEKRRWEAEFGLKLNDQGLSHNSETGQLSPSGTVIPKGQAAVSQVIKQGGQSYVNMGKTKEERETIAETILEYGGVEEYRKNMPLSYLFDENMKKAEDSATGLLSDVKTLQQYFPVNTKADLYGKGNLTGWLASKKGFLRNQDQRTAQALVEELSSEKIKELSGAAVSEQEFARLRKFLPSSSDQENEIATKLDNLDRGIRMNNAIREEAARTGKTPSQILTEKGDQYFREYGFTSNSNNQTNTEGLIDKYWK